MLRNKEILESNIADPLYNYNKNLNASITTQEVEKTIMSSKNGKSAGPDKLPYEVLKNDTLKLCISYISYVFPRERYPGSD